MSIEKKATIAFIAFILLSVIWVLSHPEPNYYPENCDLEYGWGRANEVECY